MLIILQILLTLTIGRCTDGPIFEAKTVAVEQEVQLTCPRDSNVNEKLFWIKLVSGNFPEILAGTITLDYKHDVKYDDHITAKQGTGTFVLHIRKTQLNDTAVYYCVQVDKRMTFLRGTFLRIKGPESDVTAITRVSPSDPVLPEDVVNFQCSVLSAAKKTTCGEEHKLYWFKTGPADAHPSPVFASESSTGECSESGGGPSQQECVYSFSKSINSSDAGEYFCAVATCGLIVFGKQEKLNTGEGSTWPFSDLKTANVPLLVMFPVMAVTLVVTAFLVWALKTKSCDCCIAAVSVPPSVCNSKKQRDEDGCTNTAVLFTMMKGDGGRARDAVERRRIHYAIKAFGFD